jgi:hypothetical protein
MRETATDRSQTGRGVVGTLQHEINCVDRRIAKIEADLRRAKAITDPAKRKMEERRLNLEARAIKMQQENIREGQRLVKARRS